MALSKVRVLLLQIQTPAKHDYHYVCDPSDKQHAGLIFTACMIVINSVKALCFLLSHNVCFWLQCEENRQ